MVSISSYSVLTLQNLIWACLGWYKNLVTHLPMVLILDGCSEYDAHVLSKFGNFTCKRHLFPSLYLIKNHVSLARAQRVLPYRLIQVPGTNRQEATKISNKKKSSKIDGCRIFVSGEFGGFLGFLWRARAFCGHEGIQT